MEHKLLLKDLPFCLKGTIISKADMVFYTDRGETFYEHEGSSHNGRYEYQDIEEELLKALWDNPEWLGQYGGGYYWRTNNKDKITLEFKTSMPADILVCLTKRLASECKSLIISTLTEE